MKPAVTQAKLLIPRLPAGLPAWTTFFQAATTEKPATMSAPKTALPIVFRRHDVRHAWHRGRQRDPGRLPGPRPATTARALGDRVRPALAETPQES